MSRLGFRGAAFRPARSVLSAALVASAAFIIVSVDAFRRGGGELTQDQASGTGGYVLLAQSEVPIVHDPDTRGGPGGAGRAVAGIRAGRLHALSARGRART